MKLIIQSIKYYKETKENNSYLIILYKIRNRKLKYIINDIKQTEIINNLNYFKTKYKEYDIIGLKEYIKEFEFK